MGVSFGASLFIMAKKVSEKKEVKRFELKHVIELVVFSFLLAILIAPGLFYTNVIAHEFYHYAKHQDVAEEICIDINKPYWGHVEIGFDNQKELLKYEVQELDEEEKNADIFGRVASVMYLVNALIVVNWMLLLIVRKQKKK